MRSMISVQNSCAMSSNRKNIKGTFLDPNLGCMWNEKIVQSKSNPSLLNVAATCNRQSEVMMSYYWIRAGEEGD